MKQSNKEFEELVKSNIASIYGFLCHFLGNSDDADDATQETFVKAWRKYGSFDQNRNFRVWLFAIARNTGVDHLKKRKSIPFSSLEENDDDFASTISDPAPLPPELLASKDLAKTLENALTEVKPPYREVLLLYYTEQLNFREISEATGESLNTVKSRHRRGLIRLRKLLDPAKF